MIDTCPQTDRQMYGQFELNNLTERHDSNQNDRNMPTHRQTDVRTVRAKYRTETILIKTTDTCPQTDRRTDSAS